jgi:hypothetical protein
MAIRVLQLTRAGERRVALVEEPKLRLLAWRSVYELAESCVKTGHAAAAEVERWLTADELDYHAVYRGESEWRILAAADHPEEPARCLVTGTGLTHMASAKNRQAMHGRPEDLTDSMKMYRWGLEGGKPAAGEIGAAPEWFYKGTGLTLRAHGEPLEIPWYAEDGGEEPEVAAVYLIDAAGDPWRIGFAQGNEFSDHELERRNYLYLAASKLRTCAIGPELTIGAEFERVDGRVAIERAGATVWSQAIRSGEQAMSHSLANLEHHHFKFEHHRRPGDLHVHFLGADAFSFGEGVRLEDADVMSVQFEGFGRALRNPVKRVKEGAVVRVRAIVAR